MVNKLVKLLGRIGQLKEKLESLQDGSIFYKKTIEKLTFETLSDSKKIESLKSKIDTAKKLEAKAKINKKNATTPAKKISTKKALDKISARITKLKTKLKETEKQYNKNVKELRVAKIKKRAIIGSISLTTAAILSASILRIRLQAQANGRAGAPAGAHAALLEGPGNDPTCSICLTNANTRTTCDHSFHQECIDQALQFDNRCPLCRNPIQLQ